METIHSNQTVEESMQAFYKKNDFSEDGGANEKYAWIRFGFFSLPMPNLESRKNNIYLHDVSHIVTGYDTSWKGESAVSAWEVASGGWKNLLFPWFLTLWAMGLGVIFYNTSTLEAFRKGLTMQNGLTCGRTKNEILRMTVAELRLALSNKFKSNKNPFLWSLISIAVFTFPFISVLAGLFIGIQML